MRKSDLIFLLKNRRGQINRTSTSILSLGTFAVCWASTIAFLILTNVQPGTISAYKFRFLIFPLKINGTPGAYKFILGACITHVCYHMCAVYLLIVINKADSFQASTIFKAPARKKVAFQRQGRPLPSPPTPSSSCTLSPALRFALASAFFAPSSLI